MAARAGRFWRVYAATMPPLRTTACVQARMHRNSGWDGAGPVFKAARWRCKRRSAVEAPTNTSLSSVREGKSVFQARLERGVGGAAACDMHGLRMWTRMQRRWRAGRPSKALAPHTHRSISPNTQH